MLKSVIALIFAGNILLTLRLADGTDSWGLRRSEKNKLLQKEKGAGLFDQHQQVSGSWFKGTASEFAVNKDVFTQTRCKRKYPATERQSDSNQEKAKEEVKSVIKAETGKEPDGIHSNESAFEDSNDDVYEDDLPGDADEDDEWAEEDDDDEGVAEAEDDEEARGDTLLDLLSPANSKDPRKEPGDQEPEGEEEYLEDDMTPEVAVFREDRQLLESPSDMSTSKILHVGERRQTMERFIEVPDVLSGLQSAADESDASEDPDRKQGQAAAEEDRTSSTSDGGKVEEESSLRAVQDSKSSALPSEGSAVDPKSGSKEAEGSSTEGCEGGGGAEEGESETEGLPESIASAPKEKQVEDSKEVVTVSLPRHILLAPESTVITDYPLGTLVYSGSFFGPGGFNLTLVDNPTPPPPSMPPVSPEAHGPATAADTATESQPSPPNIAPFATPPPLDHLSRTTSTASTIVPTTTPSTILPSRPTITPYRWPMTSKNAQTETDNRRNGTETTEFSTTGPRILLPESPAEATNKCDWFYKPKLLEIPELESLPGESSSVKLPIIKGPRRSVVEAWENQFPSGTPGPDTVRSFWDFWKRVSHIKTKVNEEVISKEQLATTRGEQKEFNQVTKFPVIEEEIYRNGRGKMRTIELWKMGPDPMKKLQDWSWRKEEPGLTNNTSIATKMVLERLKFVTCKSPIPNPPPILYESVKSKKVKASSESGTTADSQGFRLSEGKLISMDKSKKICKASTQSLVSLATGKIKLKPTTQAIISMPRVSGNVFRNKGKSQFMICPKRKPMGSGLEIRRHNSATVNMSSENGDKSYTTSNLVRDVENNTNCSQFKANNTGPNSTENSYSSSISCSPKIIFINKSKGKAQKKESSGTILSSQKSSSRKMPEIPSGSSITHSPTLNISTKGGLRNEEKYLMSKSLKSEKWKLYRSGIALKAVPSQIKCSKKQFLLNEARLQDGNFILSNVSEKSTTLQPPPANIQSLQLHTQKARANRSSCSQGRKSEKSHLVPLEKRELSQDITGRKINRKSDGKGQYLLKINMHLK